jgi:hypothetical protein
MGHFTQLIAEPSGRLLAVLVRQTLPPPGTSPSDAGCGRSLVTTCHSRWRVAVRKAKASYNRLMTTQSGAREAYSSPHPVSGMLATQTHMALLNQNVETHVLYTKQQLTVMDALQRDVSQLARHVSFFYRIAVLVLIVNAVLLVLVVAAGG